MNIACVACAVRCSASLARCFLLLPVALPSVSLCWCWNFAFYWLLHLFRQKMNLFENAGIVKVVFGRVRVK